MLQTKRKDVRGLYTCSVKPLSIVFTIEIRADVR